MGMISNPHQEMMDQIRAILTPVYQELSEMRKELSRLRQEKEAETLLTNKKAAELLGVRIESVHRMRREGRISYVGPGIKRYRKSDLLALSSSSDEPK